MIHTTGIKLTYANIHKLKIPTVICSMFSHNHKGRNTNSRPETILNAQPKQRARAKVLQAG